MIRFKFVGAFVLACVSVSASNAAPELSFIAGETWLRGGTPGMRMAWMGMLREWNGSHARIRYVRGSGTIPAEGLSLADGKDSTRSIWAITGITNTVTILQSSPDAAVSAEPIEVIAIAGETEIRIRSGVVFGTYTRPDGTTWSFSAGDADPTDAGEVPDGWIVLPLSTLARFTGNGPAPTALRPGDKILLMDPEESRASVIQVRP